ncbi:MAG: vWA domain-containing protein [bacterium]
MRRSNLAFMISLVIHLILALIFMNIHRKEIVRYGKPSIAIEFNVKAPEPKLENIKPKIEPIKLDSIQRKTNVSYSSRPMPLSANTQLAVATAVKNISARGESTTLPYGIQLPQASLGSGASFNGAVRARGAEGYGRGGKSQLVDFVDRTKGKRDIIYCLDVSASMGSANKLNLSRNYLKDSLLALNENDRFNIIVFSKSFEIFHEHELLPATKENKLKAMSFLDNFTPQSIRVNTKTDLLSPLLFALDMKPMIIVAVTDGLPTSGVINPENILQSIKEKNINGAKIFAIGMEMDQDQPEAWLMKAIAEQNNGECQFF